MVDNITPVEQKVAPEQAVASATPATEAIAAPVITETSVQEIKAEPAVTVLGEKQEPKVIDIKTGTEKPTEVKVEEAKPVEIKKDEVRPEADKPVEAEKPAEVKKDESKQSDEPAPLPTYELKLPDEIVLDKDKFGEFTKDLAEFETLTKADHAEMQKFGQKLVDRYVAEMERTVKGYQDAWVKQTNDWKESFEKDPEIGGNRMETTKNAALEFIATHGGTPEQQQEFRKLMDLTGAGNHPAMIRMLAKAMTAMGEGKPVPASKPSSEVRSKVATRYGNKQN